MRADTWGAGFAALLIAGLHFESISPVQAQSIETEDRLAAVERGLCDADETYALAIHGGAVFARENHDLKTAFIRRTLTEAGSVLASGARAIDVVEAVVASLEDSGAFNAGKGGIANQAGVVELDASIMDGRDLQAGAVASVKALRNPIAAARLVMDRSRHVMLVGPDADRFVLENGGAGVDASYFLYGGRNFDDVVLPDDIRIKPPGETIAPDKAAFSGAWAGAWTGVPMNHVLVVEEIDLDRAQVIYAFGANPFTPDRKGLYRRLPALFVDGGLQVTEPKDLGGFTTTYRLNPNGSLTVTTAKSETGESYQTTLTRWSGLGIRHDGGTVGAVVRDRCRDLAAGTSTGGFGAKTPGRVGDTPIIGAGTYADNETAAISATGHGEFFMRHVVAYAITAVMRHKGLSLEAAATGLIERDLADRGLRGGVIAVDRNGTVAMPYNTEGMVRGVTTHEVSPRVDVY